MSTTIYSHDLVNAERLADLLSASVGVFSEEPAPGTPIIHLKTLYRESEGDPDELYRNDLWVRRQQTKGHPLFDLYADEVPECLKELIQFSGCDPIASAGKWSAPGPAKESVRAIEDRLIIQYASSYLTPAGRKHIDLNAPEVPPFVVEEDLSDCPGKTALLVDAVLPGESLKEFISYVPSGFYHSNYIAIYSHFSTVREILRRRFFRKYLAEKSIKLWHVTEWQEPMVAEYSHPRTSLLTCGFILAQGNHPKLPQVVASCQHLHNAVAEHAKAAHAKACDYYESDQFAARLEEVRKGAKPRILIEQACSSVFVKQFSRFSAAEFKRQGFDVYIHPDCPPDRCDNYFANTIEVAEFKPDLMIRSPNGFARTPLQEIPGLPTIYPLQDHDPHMHFPAYIKKFPMSPQSFCLIIEDRFLTPIRKAGVGEDQVFFDYLPTEEPPIDVDCEEQTDTFDVGFVKTMSHYLDLSGILKTVDQEMKLTDEEIEILQQVEGVVIDQIHRNGFIPFEECQKMAPSALWLNGILALAHERQCVRFISQLATSDVSLGLTGNNWDKFEGLGRYGLGYASDRSDYYRRFFQNKINLSINPWDIYHPRIFEGGRCGAFFLIYRMPDHVAWQQLPEQLVAGKHFDYFTNPMELKEKVHYYLERPELRRQMGQALREVVETHFTYEVYCKTLIGRYRTLLEKGAPIC